MVLGALGLAMDEASLRALTDCSSLGTEAFRLLEAARQLGFPGSRKYTLLSVEELATVLAEGVWPIVYVDMWPLQGGRSGQYHAMVVLDVAPDQVTVLDPQRGECRLPREEFQEAWAAMRGLTIVIRA
jgi:ABC-type bacteriocin/lantibiotic exporter with double-glycine peptidase domain